MFVHLFVSGVRPIQIVCDNKVCHSDFSMDGTIERLDVNHVTRNLGNVITNKPCSGLVSLIKATVVQTVAFYISSADVSRASAKSRFVPLSTVNLQQSARPADLTSSFKASRIRCAMNQAVL